TPVVRSVVETCRSDAGLRLATALHLAAGARCSSTTPHAGPWSGDVLVTLPWGAQMLLEAGLVDALLKRRSDRNPATNRLAATPLVPVCDALADTELTLRVELAPCELGLGALQALQVGDVVRLQHGVGQPATVIDAG